MTVLQIDLGNCILIEIIRQQSVNNNVSACLYKRYTHNSDHRGILKIREKKCASIVHLLFQNE